MWGTQVTVEVCDAIDATALVDSCLRLIHRTSLLLDSNDVDSEIVQIARGEIPPEHASPELREVLKFGDEMHAETGGAFDMTAGVQLPLRPKSRMRVADPAGLAKGWAVDQAAERLRTDGVRTFFIAIGDDGIASGCPRGTEGWPVVVPHPWERGRAAASLRIVDCAFATSSRVRQPDRIVDPRTGRPAAGFASMTVVGRECAIADGYATTAMVLGPGEGVRWLGTRPDYEGMALTDSRALLLTPGFDRYRIA
jgi:thiamine biosynthesis lipoprotein